MWFILRDQYTISVYIFIQYVEYFKICFGLEEIKMELKFLGKTQYIYADNTILMAGSQEVKEFLAEAKIGLSA